MAAAVASPPLELLVRDLEGFSIWTGPPFDNGQPKVKIPKVPCSSATFSEDGSRLMVIKPEGVISIFDCKTYKEIRSIQVPNFAAANISPRGTYLQTFQKQASPQEKNVTLWSVETGACVYNFSQKNMSKTSWPSIRFSSDEAVACRLVTNEIQFFDSADLSKGFVSRLRVPGVAAFQLSKMPGSHVATFVPESKGVPANVQIFACGNDPSSQPLARRSFFRCSTVQLHWNYGSTGLLAVAQADVDKTNQSYYGESKLSYLTTDGAHEGLVPLRKEGPIHDVQWSYTGTEFAVVYGFMPAKATVFDKKCNPLLELGSVLCLAGFGNLPGDMAFWDCTEKKQLGTTKAEWSVVSEWSPNGCFFMTASTAPRRQIDNGYADFILFSSRLTKFVALLLLLPVPECGKGQADWKPESADRFGDISELVKSVGSLKIEEAKAQGQGSKPSQNAAKSNPVNPPQKPAAYLPPSARKAASVKAELFGGLDTQEMSKNALKNKKKREKQREKKAAEGASGSNP
uniref:Eukaryotic translation initiation factor 2A n=1 Tax=Chenopodium quinoa TaxID=63459 RepID=A0A803M5S5_CHEQI